MKSRTEYPYHHKDYKIVNRFLLFPLTLELYDGVWQTRWLEFGKYICEFSTKPLFSCWLPVRWADKDAKVGIHRETWKKEEWIANWYEKSQDV